MRCTSCTPFPAPPNGKGGAPPAGMETGEQHAVGVVLGGPGGDRPDCDVGARNVTEHVLH
jgi:hypothetical protein